MTLSIITTNSYVYFRGISLEIVGMLDRISSYKVVGAEHVESYRRGRWDGKEHLLKLHRSSGKYRAPIGLLEDFCSSLRDAKVKYKVICNRRMPHNKLNVDWSHTIKMRPYQKEAVKSILSSEYGNGILKMPIRSGKTKTCARIIYKLGRRTLFIVPSQQLLNQSHDSLSDALQTKVGLIGDSIWDERDITIASIQTLVKRRGNEFRSASNEYKRLVRSYDIAVFDECHHLKGDKWRKVMLEVDAQHKIGLSATVYLNLKSECERGVIWLKACCGNIRYEISPSELIESGYLMRPTLWLYRISDPKRSVRGWYSDLLSDFVYNNDSRNRKIVDVTYELVQRGLRVLIVTKRLKQVSVIGKILKLRKIPFSEIIGKTKKEIRDKRIKNLQSGKIKVLIGTVLGEGIDIPELEVVINAEGGKDVKAAVQRMRNLTTHEGKTEAIFVDFMDLTNEYTAKHSLQRLRTYREEYAFNFEIKN